MNAVFASIYLIGSLASPVFNLLPEDAILCSNIHGTFDRFFWVRAYRTGLGPLVVDAPNFPVGHIPSMHCGGLSASDLFIHHGDPK